MEETESTQIESTEESTIEEAQELEQHAQITLPLTAIISALIFSSPKPISSEKLLDVSGASSEDLLEALDRIREIYSAERTGYSLVEVSGGFVFRTAVELAPMIKKLLPPKIKRLSHAAAETLAIIVY
jgi:segregation and condensation protein B